MRHVALNIGVKKVLALTSSLAISLAFLASLPGPSLVKAEDKELKFKGFHPIRPREVKFESFEDVMNFEPGSLANEEINRASIELRPRIQGSLVNPTANPRTKIQALVNSNSKDPNHASTGGEEFKAYAFDYWQYLDSFVFWEGLVPSPDVIDAAHRNGTPILGTIFYDWGNKPEYRAKLEQSLQQDSENKFPFAKKLALLAKHFNFEGYFINQETQNVGDLKDKILAFMADLKEEGKKLGKDLIVTWYESMANRGWQRYFNSLTSENDDYVKPFAGKQTADSVFLNFDWQPGMIAPSMDHAKKIGLNPYDVYTGLELQKGGSYNNTYNGNYKIEALFNHLGNNAYDNELKPGMFPASLGLYSPDTIMSLAQSGEDYHEQENIFWTGFQKDPTKGRPQGKTWYGISNIAADKTPVLGKTFNTFFNTGHGKKYFVDGEISKDGPWNYRSISGIMPTWRWWIKSTGPRLEATYDFDEAYNGPSSLKFKGSAPEEQEIMLYSSKLDIEEGTRAVVTAKSKTESKFSLGLYTSPDYKRAVYKELSFKKGAWTSSEIDLSDMAGQKIYAISLKVKGEEVDVNLGQLGIHAKAAEISAPSDLRVDEKLFLTTSDAEAKLSFAKVDNADYYEVYGLVQGKWHLLTASSNNHIYVEKLFRSREDKGRMQKLKVHAIGPNGKRSEACYGVFDWELSAQDSTKKEKEAENVVIDAEVTATNFTDKGGEGVRNMLNDTITSLSDKFCPPELKGYVDIRLTKPRKVLRWRMEHAGAGGESVNDGLMNTRDFDLYYKEGSAWKLAKQVRGNKAHVTDLVFDKPIEAQEWRLDIITADNGTPWKAVRIYNWKMYEELGIAKTVMMDDAAAKLNEDGSISVGFQNTSKGSKISIYEDVELKKLLASKEASSDKLFFDPIKLEEPRPILYYVAEKEGKRKSNVLPVRVEGLELPKIEEAAEAELEEKPLEKEPKKEEKKEDPAKPEAKPEDKPEGKTEAKVEEVGSQQLVALISAETKLSQDSYAPGEELILQIQNLKPQERLQLELHSKVYDLGYYKADERGVLKAKFTLPKDLSVGEHKLYYQREDKTRGFLALMVKEAISEEKLPEHILVPETSEATQLQSKAILFFLALAILVLVKIKKAG